MNKSTASNVAIALALLAWPLCFYGFLSQLADYARDTPSYVIERNQLRSIVCVAIGLLSIFMSTWLSGFAFSGAKARSTIAALISLGLLSFAIASMRPWGAA